MGLPDGVPATRTRPEASANAARHSGLDMTSLFQHRPRPSTAPSKSPSRRYSGPLPGFDNEIVGTSLSTVPRIKPEGSEIARKSQGQMGSILAQNKPRPQVQIASKTDPRPKTAPAFDGPIVHNKSVSVTSTPPRVKPEAADTAALGTTGLVGKLFADSMDAARRKNIENSLKDRIKPKNHIQQNIMRMKKIQKDSREKHKATSPVPIKALWRSEKYENVESRVASHSTWQKKPTPKAPRPNTAPIQTSEEIEIKVNQARKSDFISKNARNAWKPENRIRRSKSSDEIQKAIEIKAKQQNQYDLQIRGTVPDYLVKRKETWAKDKAEKLKHQPDPDCPKGHKVVPEAERRRVLEKLKLSIEDTEKQLCSMPMRQCDTLKYKQRKADLEGKLHELDEAIKIFSKKKVFVRAS